MIKSDNQKSCKSLSETIKDSEANADLSQLNKAEDSIVINQSAAQNAEFGTNFIFRQKAAQPDNIPVNFWNIVATGFKGEELYVEACLRTSKS